jgi:hypothetical protein
MAVIEEEGGPSEDNEAPSVDVDVDADTDADEEDVNT